MGPFNPPPGSWPGSTNSPWPSPFPGQTAGSTQPGAGPWPAAPVPITEIAAGELAGLQQTVSTLIRLLESATSFTDFQKRLDATKDSLSSPMPLTSTEGYVIKYTAPHPKKGEITEVVREDTGQAAIFTDLLEAQQQMAQWQKMTAGYGYSNIRLERASNV